jgi:hypothetical protein
VSALATRPTQGGHWTAHDSALYATCEIATAVAQGQGDQLPVLAHSFALDLAPNDRLLASGGYALDWWGAAGDGSYMTSSFIAGGTGVFGLGLLAATAIGSSARNARAKRNAAADAADRWRPVDAGTVHVSYFGFYLTDGQCGFRRFGWHDLVQASVTEVGGMHFHAATSGGGSSDFFLRSDWAELLFVMWAMYRNQHHPQLIGGSWLDAGFLARCRQNGYRPPPLQLTRR